MDFVFFSAPFSVTSGGDQPGHRWGRVNRVKKLRISCFMSFLRVRSGESAWGGFRKSMWWEGVGVDRATKLRISSFMSLLRGHSGKSAWVGCEKYVDAGASRASSAACQLARQCGYNTIPYQGQGGDVLYLRYRAEQTTKAFLLSAVLWLVLIGLVYPYPIIHSASPPFSPEAPPLSSSWMVAPNFAHGSFFLSLATPQYCTCGATANTRVIAE